MAEVQKRAAAPRLADLAREWRGRTVWAIGHSTHPLPEFLELLEAHGIVVLADVRTIPRSRAQPQFNRETLPRALAKVGIRYVHLEERGSALRLRQELAQRGLEERELSRLCPSHAG